MLLSKPRISKLKTGLFYTVLLTVFFGIGYAAERITISQSDKEFSAEELTVKVGDTVEFLNEDPYFHNVYSLTANHSFDLGSYAKGESKSVTFDQAGEVEVECAIHPSMYMIINVED